MPSKVAHNGPRTFFFCTGTAAQTAQKQKSRTTKSPLKHDWVFTIGVFFYEKLDSQIEFCAIKVLTEYMNDTLRRSILTKVSMEAPVSLLTLSISLCTADIDDFNKADSCCRDSTSLTILGVLCKICSDWSSKLAFNFAINSCNFITKD